ncbi:Major facilitator-type transporter ecdC [Colletotrichum orbiculare MAFF 240422]|uniref:Major facilitator-type transporter ecdC n=1 Tax=Colletotrichum orbiculare (strain 104-T / ATCC 96160 / CBS 514.97 / LARS 414 / MAFF 240422) TaxID=1213857 RepID=N4VT92_COLOR|nr:Major facilitator-type transporter ecdC [Colletotrichum orbiculare MAFF 240422]
MDTKSEDVAAAVAPAANHVEKSGDSEEALKPVAVNHQDLTAKQQYARLWTNLKKDKRYVLWALYVMSLVFGWGYDSGLSGVAIAFPEFRKAYGEFYQAGDQFVIPALWQSLWNAASTIGQVLGAFLTGQFADLVGRKLVLWAAIVLSLAASFALVFAPSLPILFVSKLLLGLSVGLSTVTPPLYVTENAPAALRSTLSSLTNVIIVLGFFLSSITGWGSSKISGQWSYRLAFSMTFLVPTLFAIVLPFLPESPVWYVKKGRDDDARRAIVKLYGETVDVEERLGFIKSELETEAGEASAAKKTSWAAIFTKEHRWRTLVAVLGLQSQNFSGGYFANTYQTYYLELVGQSDPFGLTAISSTLQFLSNCVAVSVSDVLPRRKALIGGGTLLCCWGVVIGGTSLAGTSNQAANTALLAFMITWSMLYTATVGCFGWAVAQETASQATRPKTIAFTLVCQQLTALLLSSVFPFFINPDQLNWGGKVMFLFVGAEIFLLGGLWLFQPETKNRTYQDIDFLYAQGVPARRFSDYAVADGGVLAERVPS